MKLFQRIFLTFFFVIIAAIFVASFSFWLVQDRVAESRFKQQRAFETGLLNSTVTVFQTRGLSGVRETLQDWNNTPTFDNILVISGDSKTDIFQRQVEPARILAARKFAAEYPNTRAVRVAYDPLGEEYIFMLADWDKQQPTRLPSPLMIPGVEMAPVWHELIILSFIIIVGLLLAYILARNISQPIRTLERGMSRLAEGDLETRISHQLLGRRDELAKLAVQFDYMAGRLQKLVERERHLLHHVSHEMRSPLARMQALLALLQVQPHKQEQNIKRLESELTRMDKLVGELLTLSRLETANVEMEKDPLKLVPFLENLVEDCRAIAVQNNQQIDFTYDPEDAEATVSANEGYLYRAFDNVLRNAMAYSPEGSKIHIRLSGHKHHWHIDIADNGPGVDERQLPHIFTAFYRADSGAHKPGTGLGLAIARHVIGKHNGRISAANVQPNGLNIHFELPELTAKQQKLEEKEREEKERGQDEGK